VNRLRSFEFFNVDDLTVLQNCKVHRFAPARHNLFHHVARLGAELDRLEQGLTEFEQPPPQTVPSWTGAAQ
jgi:hypothetical protein